MKLILNNTYKFLEPFTLSLPKFVILTGLNGAGKTQLLQAIQSNRVGVQDENGNALNSKMYVTSQMLSPNESIVITKQQLDQDAQSTWELIKIYQNEKRSSGNIQLKRFFEHSPDYIKTIEMIAKSANKNVDALTVDDVFQFYPLNNGLKQTDIFHHNFSSLFKRYQDKQEDNEYRQFRNEVKGKSSIPFLSSEEFVKTYGEAPWDVVNRIIAEANLDYYINSPFDNHRDAPFELKLINNLNSAEIKFEDLSSGEKVLMSLALALYNSNFDIDFPKILLMDEPDASLHPSMTKQFLNVIENVFVKEKNLKVIMTTHSPSTVALAPEGALYQMNKLKPRPIKTTKDKAIKTLTEGIPSLSVSYENRRQVFVESKNDVYFYEKIYSKLRSILESEISLNFISSGVEGSGSSNQVKNIVNTLSRYGNKFIYGIIDWDKTNNGNNFVKVLGREKRYSIENYLFDPLILAAYLLREKHIKRSELKLEESDTFISFAKFESAKLQKITDLILQKLKNKFGDNLDSECQSCQLVNGSTINLPNWFLLNNGHDLESKVKMTFSPLNRFANEGKLKREILDKIVDDIPEIISADLVDLLKDIQK